LQTPLDKCKKFAYNIYNQKTLKEVLTMSKSLQGTKTLENLKHAFAGESQANRRYLYFAR